MLRISPSESSGCNILLRLEGRVVGPWVAALHETSEQALRQAGRLSLDLADVAFVDKPGLELLNALRARGVSLLNPSPFVAEQLKHPPSPQGSGP